MEPEVERHLALERTDSAHALGGERDRWSEQLASERIRLPLGGCDQQLVREATRMRTEQDEVCPLADDVALEQRVQVPFSGGYGRCLAEPGQLRVRVRQARAGGAALVD